MDFKKIAKEVLEIEANELLKADVSGIEKAVEIAYNTKGKLIVTGVGKSGLIGSKIAATLASTGTPSFFIHPTEALHGDLGMITKDDSVLAISYSGESEELIKILPHIKRFEVPLIAMTGDKNSTLAKYADALINIHIDKEACPLNVAPTSSTTLTLAMGDALAVCLMKKRNFTKEDFASFHPGGSLGKKLFIKVKDLMKENFPIANKDDNLKEAIIKMTEGKLGHILFLEDNRVRAILSDGDLRRAMMSEDFDLEKKAIEFATKNPKTIKKDILASDALKFMEENKIQLLPVVNEKEEVVGVIHIHDLVEAGIK
ncbi:KpsF/GutQ family sugar-phosphate isomerase [Caminibacter mediatlanticus TB-2]|uniref:KpsF/GutQ family sugar-phosphate isomerase n=1 Tax=Caminibacter mediatlanticus TB-2 TaxID=391592 RepID=A0ABX5VBP1_9BACT|nr:KpsF/GutQ family sugar-phosphate isomerase [Caminibacter mediatlanticus]QCT94016.1 KpsF/GutQ family sugar-phosphate isomerase [Caminibacter mediatlanticus TB-2]